LVYQYLIMSCSLVMITDLFTVEVVKFDNF